MKHTLVLLTVGASLAGCVSFSKRFNMVEEGMTPSEVNEVMDTGPESFSQPKDGYKLWAYKDGDFCILFKDDKVVKKELSSEDSQLVVPGVIHVSKKQRANCLPE